MTFREIHDAAERGELLCLDGGACWYVKGRDSATILGIITTRRGAGVGRELVNRVLAACPGLVVRAACLPDGPHGFWERMGFRAVDTNPARTLWERTA